MNKLSIGHGIIEVETHEKTNVMSSGNTMAGIVCGVSLILILFGRKTWIELGGFIILASFIFVWIVIYICHHKISPNLLQSETYRIESQKIEAGMYENKNDDLVQSDRSLPFDENIPLLIDNSDDIEVENE